MKLVSGEEDISESLSILLSTTIGERILRPTYGCDLKEFLFEPIDPALSAQIRDVVETAILYFEPRVELEGLDVSDDDALEGKLLISIDYRIRSTNTRRNMVFPFYKQEGTDIPQ